MTKHPLLQLVAATSLFLGPEVARGQATSRPSERSGGWSLGRLFDYARPERIVVEESTPSKAHLSFHGRPPQLRESGNDLDLTERTAEPTTVGSVDIRRLRFKDADGDLVTALLCTPAGKPGPFPLAIAVHGLNSNKAQVCGQVAPALAKRGFAVLAPDMPVHGERPGSPQSLFQSKDWMTAISLHRRAIIDIRQCIDVAEKRPDIDASRGVVLTGYSMGAWLHSIAGPIDPRVRAMVLMVGGATDAGPVLRMLPQLAAADPLQALPHFAGRPLLMLNGLHDMTVTPEMAERLYQAAAEPKQQKWYDSGHLLPDRAYDDAAKWVAETWTKLAADAPAK